MGILDIITYLSASASVISATALAFSVYYSHKQTKALQGQVEELKKQNAELLKKPKLKLEIYGATVANREPVYIAENITIGEAKIIKLKIENTGNTQARECVVKAIKFTSSGSVTSLERLIWHMYFKDVCIYGKEKVPFFMTITKNDFELVDLIVLFRYNANNANEKETFLGSQNLKFNIPYNQIESVNAPLVINQDDIIKIIVYCENSDPASLCLRIKKKKHIDDIMSDQDLDDFIERIENSDCNHT
ncbi:hypothetical protein [Acidianus manzaensis]|uniref:Uncharacterized protein n=1 Tax=Acidianus manzaensis TaxID=282676 RepID=A0A1W6K360_9CREN|nr:hypothetical protein [Acidianus manzaensis]ARM76956.1 hypothetical protein B6F84_13645 [Acidianus manzaensis]